MTRKPVVIVVLAAALAALAGTISYAVARANDGGSNYGSMMSGDGYSMMGGNGHRSAWFVNGSGLISTIPAARARAQRFGDRFGLKPAEVIQFSDNFYVRLDDQQGKPATEVLVDPRSGAVTLEYGPAMMWNTRYRMMSGRTTGAGGMMGGGMMGGSGSGMMGGGSSRGMATGMMGHYGSSPTWTPRHTGPVDAAQARALANRWLSDQGTGQSTGNPDAFPGYYTMETLKDGKVAGMISVNQATGAVWYHWWHGRFVAIAE
jgi:hypothetical protein